MIRYQSSDTVSVPVIFVVLVAEHITGDPRIALRVMYSAAVYPVMDYKEEKGKQTVLYLRQMDPLQCAYSRNRNIFWHLKGLLKLVE